MIGEYSPRAPEGRVTGDNMTMSQPVPFIQKARHEEGGLGKSKLNRFLLLSFTVVQDKLQSHAYTRHTIPDLFLLLLHTV